MPIYEYTCSNQHRVERFRKISQRHDDLLCPECRRVMHLAVSRPHVAPDGIYSYAPNVGSAEAFERKRDAIKNGVKVIEKRE